MRAVHSNLPGLSTDPDRSDALANALFCAAEAVASNGGEDIFEVLVCGAARALGVDLSFIGVLMEGAPEMIRTIGACDRGQVLPNFEYQLMGTPCEGVVGQQFRYHPEGIQELFPDPHVKEIGGVGYAAIPLYDSSGGSMGLMAVVDRRPLRDRALTESILKIFSVRAAVELERRTADEARRCGEEERVRLEGQLRQAQKMEAIGQLTGGIAHDFNNILTGTMGYLAMARERAEGYDDAKLSKYLDRAERSGQRAKALIGEMLTFSRGQRGESRSLQLGPQIADAVKLLESSLPSSLEIETDLDPDVPLVLLDPLHVEQVLMNLCINARDAMQGKGTLEISLRTAACEGCVCSSCHQPVAGSFVELAVTDSGPGIAPQVLERMFEPFFSTKEVGKGSGMGLSMVHGIVHEYGGHIHVDTLLEQGTRFRIWFPAWFPATADKIGPEGSRRPDTSAQNDTPNLRGRVLLADDEASVRELMDDLLSSWGLRVTLVENGLEACERFAEDPDGFDLVVLDQTMPRMTGLEAAEQLRKLRTHTPLVLYTGYSEHLTEARTSAAGISALARKPLDIPAFRSLVEELLLR